MPKLALVSTLLVVAIAALSLTAPAIAGTPLPNGDVNDDGVANAIDAALVLQFQAGFISEPPPNSDVNLDGARTSVDAALILQYSAALLPYLPYVPMPSINGEPTITPSGLGIYDIRAGTGQLAEPYAAILVRYTGWLEDGRVIDASPSVQFRLGTLIEGWNEGVPEMRVGGERRLIIPPELAYGTQGYGDVIPPNATLIFDIELISVP